MLPLWVLTFRGLRRADGWRIHIVSKTYGVLPSEVAMLPLPEFHFNEAVAALGIRVENKLNAHYDEKKNERRPELHELLHDKVAQDDTPAQAVDVALLDTEETRYFRELVSQGITTLA